jgi:hypothetical protein
MRTVHDVYSIRTVRPPSAARQGQTARAGPQAQQPVSELWPYRRGRLLCPPAGRRAGRNAPAGLPRLLPETSGRILSTSSFAFPERTRVARELPSVLFFALGSRPGSLTDAH